MVFNIKPLGLFSYLRWREGSQINQYIISALANFPTLVCGMFIGWVSPAIPQLQSSEGPLDEPISEHQLGLLASLGFLVAIPAMIVTGPVSDAIGRKATILTSSLTLSICWLIKISYLTSNSIIVARTLAGLGLGICYVVPPIYVKEIADDNIRGKLGSMLILAQNLGFLTTYIIGAYLSFDTVLWISFLIPVAHFLIFFSAPETPSSLVKKKKKEEAIEVLAWLRSVAVTNKNVIEDINTIEADLYSENVSEAKLPWRDLLTNRTALKAFGICSFILMAQECCGYLVLLVYASEVFSRSDVSSSMTADQQAIVLGLVQLAGSISAFCLIERIGRKPLLGCMSFTCGLGMLILGCCFYAQSIGTTPPSWLPITAMCLAIFSTAAGFQPAPFVIMTEMFNLKLRGLVSSITVSLTALADFIQTEAYQPVTNVIGPHSTFWIFAIICFLGTAITVIFIPETRNKSVEEIYQSLGGVKELVQSNSLELGVKK